MIAWRICKSKYASTALKGIGASKTGGRFNSPGSPPVIYTACSTLALAVVEVLVHLPDRRMPPGFCYIRADIPDEVSKEERDANNLPVNWEMWPHPDSTREIGDDWLSRKASCLLLVPSVVTKVDLNCLINPQHEDFSKISFDDPVPLEFDKRLFETS